MSRIYIRSDNLIKVVGLRDALAGTYVNGNGASVAMSLFESPALHPNVGSAVSEIQTIRPDAPATCELAFTAGGTVEPKIGNKVIGATSAKTAIIASITLTSGSWAGGNAAGTLTLVNQSGTFVAEDLELLSTAITVFATANGGARTLVTSALHGLVEGNTGLITGNDHYVDAYVIEFIDVNSFEIAEPFVDDDPPRGQVAAYVCAVAGDSTPGSFTLSYDGETTGAIAGDATLAAVKTALELLVGVAVGDILVGGVNFNTSPVGNGMTFTFKNTLGNTPLLSIDYSLLVGPAAFTAERLTTGYLNGVTTSEDGGNATGIPVTGHEAAAAGFIFIAGSLLHNAEYVIESVERDKIIIDKAYVAETFTGEETIHIGIDGTKAIPFEYIATSDGDWKGYIPDNLKRLIKDKPIALFITADAGATRLTILIEGTATYYSG